MAKYGDFGSVPDDLFGLVVGLYATVVPGQITDQNRIDGLAALAKAEHAAANPSPLKDPSVVSLTMLCIEMEKQFDKFKGATTQPDRDDAIAALKDALIKLEGLWK